MDRMGIDEFDENIEMIEALNIPEFRKRIAPISVELYHRMIEKGVFGEKSYELIEGSLVEKMSKSELHILIVRLLWNALNEQCPEGHFVQKEDPITLDNSEPEPDLAVIAGNWRTISKPQSALFVIEVAITSLTEDRTKAAAFARAEIPEYWIVRPEAGKTEVFTSPLNGKYSEKQIIHSEEEIESTSIPGFRFSLAEALKQLAG